MHKTTHHKTRHNNARQNGHSTMDLYGQLEHMKNSLAEITGNMTDKTYGILASSLKQAKRRTNTLQKNTSRFVAKKPYQALGLAAITFLCLGYFLKR